MTKIDSKRATTPPPPTTPAPTPVTLGALAKRAEPVVENFLRGLFQPSSFQTEPPKPSLPAGPPPEHFNFAQIARDPFQFILAIADESLKMLGTKIETRFQPPKPRGVGGGATAPSVQASAAPPIDAVRQQLIDDTRRRDRINQGHLQQQRTEQASLREHVSQNQIHERQQAQARHDDELRQAQARERAQQDQLEQQRRQEQALHEQIVQDQLRRR